MFCRAAPSCRFQSAMRAAVPSSIHPLSRSAPIGDVLIIVVHTAPATFSRNDGGATTDPSRSPGNRLFDKLVTHGVDFVLAGSIRDDGPLPETMMDLVSAQEEYAAALSNNVQLVLMLSSMLHSIGVGNMLPSWVRVVCVDINPAVVTKLADRGSMQTVGVVTDVGLFLHRLAEALRN